MDKQSKRDLLANTQLDLISTTGRLSGRVKELLINFDENEMINIANEIENDLKALNIEICNICLALNIDRNSILGGVKDDI